MKTKVCIIGCGAISGVHIEAVKNCKNAELYGICDIDESKKEKADKLNVRFFADFDDVLCDKEVNAVHICTPHYLHFEMIKKALERGKKVVCEKPCVITKAEFDELKTLGGIEKVSFVMQNRLNKSIEELKKLIENDALGNIVGISGILTWHRTKEYYGQADWRGKWATEGGGVLINQAIHTLDLMTYFAGEVDSVEANMANLSLSDAIEVEDTCTAYLKFKSGISGVFFATNANAENDDFEITVYFEKGTAKCAMGKLFVSGKEICANEKAVIGKNYWGKMHEKLIADFYDKNSFFDINSVENTMNTLFAMYESSKLKRTVYLKSGM